MGRWVSILAFLVLFWSSISCSRPPDAQSRLAALEKANAQLSMQLFKVELKLIGFERRLEDLAGDEVLLDPAERGFGVVRTKNGHLLVSCEDVVQYGDGQKVTLQIGNPYNMTYSGFTVTARYGCRIPAVPDGSDSTATREWPAAYARWQDSLREKAASFTDVLVPGRWNKISLILAPARADEVGFLGLKISTDRILLYTP